MTFKNRLKGYRIVYSSRAEKIIKKLSKEVSSDIYEALNDLVDGKQNVDVKQLKGYRDKRYRLRVGDYRVIYATWEHQVVVYVIDAGHRKEVYEG
jgi:mRNA interferase RelE/StbE